MKIKLAMSLFLCLLSLNISAQKTQPLVLKIEGSVTTSQKNLIADTFIYLNKFWADKGKSLSQDITEKYFTKDTTLIINGKTVYTELPQFESHFKKVGKTIKGNIRFPLHEIIGVDNKLIVHFDEDIYDGHGTYYPTNVIAIFTLHNNKIQRWEEVVNSSYFCRVESLGVVYSK